MLSFVKNLLVKYEQPLSILAIIAGFIPDAVFLRRVDLLPESLLLYSYLGVIGVSILLIHLYEEGKLTGAVPDFIRPWLSIILNFTFGNILSAFFIFYSRSGSLLNSWPFLLLLVLIFIGLEMSRKYRNRLVLQLGMYFFVIFSFCIFAVPLWLNAIGTNIFLISGGVSVVLFGVFAALLSLLGAKRFSESSVPVFLTTAGIYICMNAFYFLDVLPPLPLAMKEVEVYHVVEKLSTSYRVRAEPHEWYEKIMDETVHVKIGTPLYVFSSVFTPIQIKTDVVHRWEHWNNATHAWKPIATVQFPVTGGRDGGYRGFSTVPILLDGKWRVSVETPDGRFIGRVEFFVAFVQEEPYTTETIR